MDLLRSLGARLLGKINGVLKDFNQEGASCVITGGAVTGKTVLLKRLAWDLAKSGELVLWMKPWWSCDVVQELRETFQKIASLKEWKGKPVVIFMDDPLSFGSLSARDVVIAARSAGVRILLVEAVRTSDWSSWEYGSLVGSLPVVVQEELSDSLDDDEWRRLPDYLVSLGIAADREVAEKALIGIKGTSAHDTLSMLYYLLPQTRVTIASSIRDEYFRLGDVAGLTKVILKAAQAGTGILKRAYEMVAVADHYRGRLPIEDLVSALGLNDYGEWIDATRPDSPAWGLLYAEESDELQTVWYRTRNAIVTRLIVQVINGGSLSHTGELTVLMNLLRACTGRTTPMYREFCVRVLVPHEKLEELDYEEGLQLYDTAIAALPFPDRSLLHQKALWIGRKGRNPTAARDLLEEALDARDYPYTKRGEADEHIHTSLANIILAAINEGSTTIAEGKRDILKHLAKARSTSFFNPHSVHVQAKLISRLAEKEAATDTLDYYTLINQAVADIDHTLLVLHSHIIQSRHDVPDYQMLETIRAEILAKVSSIDQGVTAPPLCCQSESLLHQLAVWV
jgi:hypothetical protein